MLRPIVLNKYHLRLVSDGFPGDDALLLFLDVSFFPAIGLFAALGVPPFDRLLSVLRMGRFG